jgi:hypothetical protein
MKYKIIEDCSPYYIRYTHDGINDIINYCNECTPDFSLLANGFGTVLHPLFTHYKLSKVHVDSLLQLIPLPNEIPPLDTSRFSLFLSKPGLYYPAHKDGSNNRFSINYISKVLDDKCVTSWYSDNDLQEYTIVNLPGGVSREIPNFVKENHTPLKTMTAKQNECVLFNTDIFHDWDNRNSTNERVVLTLRLIEELKGHTYFEDARKILFNY